MGELKPINIKNRTYYFYNDVINFDEFDESKIKVEKKRLEWHWYLLSWLWI